MTVKFLSRYLLLVLTLLTTVSAFADQTVIDDEDNGTTITINPGDTVVLRLLSNPSTGYGWTVGMNNSSLLQQIGKPKNIPSDTGMAGAGGMTEFKFRAVGSGGDSLALLYQRPWEKGVQAAKTFRVFVVINRGGGGGGGGITMTVYDHDNDGRADLNVGDTLVVKLSANRTTGFSWNMDTGNLRGVLQLIGTSYEKSSNGMMGAGGVQVFRYCVTGGGGGFLQGAYQKPNSGGIRAAKTWEILVSAKQNGGSGRLGG